LGSACLIDHQCAMSPLMRFMLYCSSAPRNGPVHPASAKLFIWRLPRLFPVPYCKATGLPPGLTKPWLPVGYSLAVVHLIHSLIMSTCAPGAVCHLTTAAPWRTALWCSTVLGHCLYRQAPTIISGKKHSQHHLHTCQSWCLTLREPLKDKQTERRVQERA
jgi:hypothetical protein